MVKKPRIHPVNPLNPGDLPISSRTNRISSDFFLLTSYGVFLHAKSYALEISCKFIENCELIIINASPSVSDPVI